MTDMEIWCLPETGSTITDGMENTLIKNWEQEHTGTISAGMNPTKKRLR